MRTGTPLALLILLVATLVTGCAGGPGGGSDGRSTATVQIGLRAARAAASSLPAGITEVRLTVSAPEIATITASLPLDGTVISLEVPAGTNRVFAAEAFQGEAVTYKGQTTVPQLVAGSVVRVSITLDAVGADTTPPTVVSTVPAEGATGVAVNAAVSVTFSEPVDAVSVESSLTLAGPAGPVAGRVTVTGAVATFTPSAVLEFETEYAAAVGTGAKDLAGNAFSVSVSWHFTTGKAPDTLPPTVVSTVPADGSGFAPASAAVSVTFSEPVDPATVTSSTFTLAGPTGPVGGTLAVSGATATITPDLLTYGATYTATVTTGVRDLAGNALSVPFSWGFTIQPPPDITPPAVVSTTPPAGATGVSVNAPLNVTFSEPVDAASLTTNLTVTGPGGPVPGNVAVAGTTATFTPAANLAFAAAYTATVGTGAKDLAGNALAAAVSWTFTTAAAPDMTPPTVASTTPADGTTGVAVNVGVSVTFSEPVDAASLSSSFTLAGPAGPVATNVTVVGATATFTPAASLAFDSAYTATVGTGARDLAGNPLSAAFSWTFTTGSAPDTTPPTVTSTAPADGATGVSAGVAVTVTFSEPMNAATVNASTFTLAKGGVPVTGNVTYEPTTRTATFAPAAALESGTAYAATVTTGVRDSAGNALASNYAFVFTTADTTAPTVINTIPTNGATDVALSSFVDVVFSEPMDPTTLTPATLTLSDDAGPVSGAVAYAAAFQTATFTPAALLVRGKTYNATVTTGARDAAGNGLAAPLTFTFSTAPVDNVPPTVVSVSPASGTGSVSTRTSVSVTFSEAVDAATLTTASFKVRRQFGTADVPGAVTYDSGTFTATFTPSVQLAFGWRYDVTVTTDVKDLAGNALAAPFTSAFSARTLLAFGWSPPGQSTNQLLVDTFFTATFDPELDPQAQAAATIYLIDMRTATEVPSAKTFDPAGPKWTLTPNSLLSSATGYRLGISTAVPDGLGGTFTVAPEAIFFTANTRAWNVAGAVSTGLAGDATLPRVAMDPAGNATAVWVESANGRPSIWARRYDYATDAWGPAVTLENADAVDMVQPRVAMDDQGNAAALWNSVIVGQPVGTVYAAVYSAAAGTWGAPFVLEDRNDSCLATGGVTMPVTGQAVAVWSSCDSRVSAATLTAAGVLMLVDLTATATLPFCATGGLPDVAAGGGDAVVVWEAADPVGIPGVPSYLCSSRFSGGAWDVPVVLDGHLAGPEALEAHLVANQNRSAAVAWRRWNPVTAVYEMVGAAFLPDQGGWSAPAVLTSAPSGNAATASLAADGFGDFFVTWCQVIAPDLSYVWVDSFVPSLGGWLDAQQITSAGDTRLPRVAADLAGNALMVFSQSDPPATPRFDLWATRFDIPTNNGNIQFGIWDPPALVESVDTGDARFADIAGNSAGDAVTVWRQAVDTKTFIYANVYRAGGPPPAAPTITTEPASQTVAEGAATTFTVAAVGAPPLSYQWYRDGAAIPGATGATYDVPAAFFLDSGSKYHVDVTNRGGTASSTNAVLSVTKAIPPTVSASRGYRLTVDIFYAALASNGDVFTWGMDLFGGLGNGAASGTTSAPAQVSGLPEIHQVQAGGDHVLAVDGLGNVWAWGRNDLGQVGDGSGSNALAPLKLAGLANIVRIGAGVDHSLAVDLDGRVFAWGNNAQGQLGLGTTGGTQSTPIEVTLPAGAPVIAVAGGFEYSLALRADGTVLAWGANGDGQLGDGTTTSSPTPVTVSNLTNVKAIVAGWRHSMAAVPFGTEGYYHLYAWGANYYGQLGTNDPVTVSRSQPAQISGTATLVFGGNETGLATMLGSEGLEPRAWGFNDCGQLGNGVEGATCPGSNPSPAVLFPGRILEPQNGATSVSNGIRHSIARSGDGKVWVWGLAPNGSTTVTTPTAVPGFTLN